MTAKFSDLEFQEFSKFVKGLGMSVTSGHYGLGMIKGDTWQKAIDDAKKRGTGIYGCSLYQ